MKFISGVRVNVCVESVDGSEYDDIDYDDCLAIFKSEKGMINFVTEKMLGGYGLEELQNYITNPKYSDCVEIRETDFSDFDEDDEDGEKNDIEVTIASSSKEKVALVPFDSEDFKYRWCVQISYYENDAEEDTSEYEFADLTESRLRRGRMLRESEDPSAEVKYKELFARMAKMSRSNKNIYSNFFGTSASRIKHLEDYLDGLE